MEEYRDLFSHLIKQSSRYEHPNSNIVLSAIILDVLLKNDNKMFIDRLVPEVKLSRELVLEGLR